MPNKQAIFGPYVGLTEKMFFKSLDKKPKHLQYYFSSYIKIL